MDINLYSALKNEGFDITKNVSHPSTSADKSYVSNEPIIYIYMLTM